jgi:acyl-CoA dehydrogenase
MKLYAYRALDYVQGASESERRYLLFNAIQKAKVSTEGVKVMALLSECIGAKGFEADTYFEMALRDAQLIPGLEGSMHINLGLAAQFMPNYFARGRARLAEPESLVMSRLPPAENSYLMRARSGGVHAVCFPHFLKSYAPLMSIPNIRRFARQTKAFQMWIRANGPVSSRSSDLHITQALGQCLAIIAYAQLIAENAMLLEAPRPLVSVLFHLLVSDFSAAALSLIAAFSGNAKGGDALFRRLVVAPRTDELEWDFVAARASAVASTP